jgi:hypothetical protein
VTVHDTSPGIILRGSVIAPSKAPGVRRVCQVSGAKDVEELLTVNYETRGFEVKGPGLRLSRAFLAKVVRAALAMGNLPDVI